SEDRQGSGLGRDGKWKKRSFEPVKRSDHRFTAGNRSCQSGRRRITRSAGPRSVLGRSFTKWRRYIDQRAATAIKPERQIGNLVVVDAMVLSGCRICSSLTNETIHLEGGTRRRGKRNKESKSGESKANRRGTRYGPREQSSLPQGRQ